MQIVEDLIRLLGKDAVLTGKDCAPWSQDWTGGYMWTPLAVVRPRTTQEVSETLKLTYANDVAVVPVGGNTGLTGATVAEGAIMVSLDRMTKIEALSTDAQTVTVQAGVVLERLHEAAEDAGLFFPMTFGARGSARIGGMLATNAGGSNVLRYGNSRDLCLGIEAVLPDGRIVNLLSGLHKDNSGLALKHLFVGSEGTLGIITRATLKLVPRPKARATAMVAAKSLPDALKLLRRLQAETGGQVEAFEYMPRLFMTMHMAHFQDATEPFDAPHDVNLLVEVAATSDRDSTPDDTGVTPIASLLEDTLFSLLHGGEILDAVVAQTEAQRRSMWARREAAAEITFARTPYIDSDIAVPLDKVAAFLDAAQAAVAAIDPGAETLVVSHLGDGNIHHTVYPTRTDPGVKDAVKEAVEKVTLAFGGSFSAEHGIGLSKRASMARQKDPVALETMRAVKAALDPKGLMNPGKVLPD